MVIYIRDKKNKNYFEVEFYKQGEWIELHAHIYSEDCFGFLLNKMISRKTKLRFAKDFYELQELRGWYYEWREPAKAEEFAILLKELRIKLSEYAKRYGFHLVED